MAVFEVLTEPVFTGSDVSLLGRGRIRLNNPLHLCKKPKITARLIGALVVVGWGRIYSFDFPVYYGIGLVSDIPGAI